MTAKTPAVPFAHCTGKVSSGGKTGSSRLQRWASGQRW